MYIIVLLILRYGKWSSISMYRSNKQPLLVGRSLKQQRREKSSWGMMVCVCNDEDIQLRDRQTNGWYCPLLFLSLFLKKGGMNGVNRDENLKRGFNMPIIFPCVSVYILHSQTLI